MEACDSKLSKSFEPNIVALYCRRALANHDHLPEGVKKCSGFRVKFVMIPCSSQVETSYLIKLIEQGADGVYLVRCPENQCQFLTGSIRAEKRMKYAQTLLDEVGMGSGRLGMAKGLSLSSEELTALIEEYSDSVQLLGRNPLTGENNDHSGMETHLRNS